MQQLTIGYLSTMYHTSHIIRAERFLETRLKLSTAWVLFPTGPAMVEAFAAGAIDMGYIGLPPAMMGIAKGVPLICIGGGHVEGTVMIAAPGYQSLDMRKSTGQVLIQFKGKKLGSPTRGSIHDVIIRNLIEEAGTPVGIENFAWADLIPEAIDAGKIEGAVGTPALAVLGNRCYGTAMVIPPRGLWPFNPSYGIVVSKELLAEKNLLEDFLTIHEMACNLIRENPGQAAAIVAAAIKVVDASFVREVFSISPKYCASLPQPYITSTLTFVTALQKLGYLSRPLSRDDIFDTGIVATVHPGPDHYSHPGNLVPEIPHLT